MIPTEIKIQPTNENINQLTLVQLSTAASELWEAIEQCSDETELEKLLYQQFELQDWTEHKVDALAFVYDQLKTDLEAWLARLEAVTKLHLTVVEKRRNQLGKLKEYLLRLHNLGLLAEKVIGKERRIQFVKNSRPNVTVDEAACPAEFLEIKYIPLKEKIIAAHVSGQDISQFAEVTTGKHVRFYFEKTGNKQKK